MLRRAPNIFHHILNISYTRARRGSISSVLKKFVGLIVYEKDIFDIYLNNICHIVLSLYLVRK